MKCMFFFNLAWRIRRGVWYQGEANFHCPGGPQGKGSLSTQKVSVYKLSVKMTTGNATAAVAGLFQRQPYAEQFAG